MKIRVGVIGCGSITRLRHAPEYAENQESVLAGFCDMLPSRAEELAAQYGARVYADYEEMLADKSIDAVSVCSANETHAAISIAALRAGKHVLCEKPMAVTVGESRDMIAAARECGRFLMVGHNQRLVPARVKAKAILESGVMGRVISFNTYFKHTGPESWGIDKSKKTWFFNRKASGFGVLGDLGIHKCDLIRWLTGQEVAAVLALEGTLNKTYENGDPIEVSDNAMCLFKMSGGTQGTMHVSWCDYGAEDNSTVLYCENGVMKIFTDQCYDIILEMRDASRVRYSLSGVSTNEKQLKSGVIDAFIRSIVDGTEPEISGEEGSRSIEVVEACAESSRSGRMVLL